MDSYTKAFEELTDNQREAVEYIEGPLLVIAGPGTGKTQLLSMRVAQILKKTDASANNILCLTFTNKASANMRNRLQQLIGPESLKVNVKTFHSFAAELMGEYPDYFWNGARLTTAPDAVQADIIDSILSGLPLDNPLAIKFAGNFTSANRVMNSLKLAKEAGLTPEKLKAIIEFNLAYINEIEGQLVEILEGRLSYKSLTNLRDKIEMLPDQSIDDSIAPLLSLSTVIKESLDEAIALDDGTNKTKNTGDWKKRFVQNEAQVKAMHKQRRANEWWLQLSNVYAAYRDELHRRGCYDYADMLVEVISQLEQEPAMLSDVQERYQYVLIDEFQDSNAAQMRLAHLISSHPLNEGKPNLMVVGDDDQSIYKFNGAELNNMLGFRRTYPTTNTIVLEDNFRSSQAVLDNSKVVIELANDRLVKREADISKNLVARNEPETIGNIQHDSYPSKEHQYYGVSRVIKDFFDTDSKNKKPSIAVLARKHESLQTIAAELLKLDVPVRYEQQKNILDHEAVELLLTMCQVVQGINDGDEALVNQNIAAVIGHPMWEVEPREAWKIAVKNRYSPHWLDSLLEHEDESVKNIGHWLIWLSSKSRTVKLPLLFDYLIGLRESDNFTSPFRQYYIDARPAKTTYIEALSAVQKLRSAVNEFSLASEPSLTDFMQFIDLHLQNKLSISDESVFVSAPEAVQLLTVHKAKGLEFDIVFIIDAVEKQWQPKNKTPNTPANLPLQPYGDDMDDYIRLMYVALTRAKHSIIASSYRYDGAGEEVVPTPLLSTSLPTNKVQRQDLPDSVAVLESSIRWPALETTDAHNILRPILEEYSLNVTGLMNFLDVTKGGPQNFLERNLLRLPGARTISLAFGTAIHSSLEQAQRQINFGNFDIGKIKTHFETELKKEPILPEELERWIPHGNDLIDRLFDNQLVILPEGATPEQRLHGIDIGGAIIDGKLDHIIVDEDAVLISDYKTGAPLSSFYSQAKDAQVKIWKHKTQLIFYALLASNHPLYRGKEITCQMQYLEATNAKDFSKAYTPSSEEIDQLAELSRAVYKKISNYDLPDVSGYSQDMDGINNFISDLISGNI